MSNNFSNELMELVKNSVVERGFEKSLHDTIANQYVLEQIQTEFHCVLNALAHILIEKNVVDKTKLKELTDSFIKVQEEELKKVLESDRQQKVESEISDEKTSNPSS